MNIIQATEDPKLFAQCLKDPSTWSAWKAFLAALFGLPLTPEQLETYRACTGRTTAPTKEFDESWLIVGRRGGKSFVLAIAAVYLACFRDWRPFLTVGERGHVMVIAADRRQARTILGYVRSLLTENKMLAKLVTHETAETIDLEDKRVSIEITTANFRTVRGRTVLAALCDEIAFWQSEESANPDIEIINALKPAMGTVPGSKLLCASSPYGRRGAMWESYQRFFGKDDASALVWQASTRTMNPSFDERIVADALERDRSVAEAEYLGLFRTDVERLLTREAVEACVDDGVLERAPDRSKSYVGFVDAAGGSGGDSFTCAISHKEGTTVVLDAVREIAPPFSPEAAIAEISNTLRQYRISSVIGDRYAALYPVEIFRRHGIFLTPSERSKSELYADLVPCINSRSVDLLDHKKLVSQLINLERRTRSAGRDSIDHPPNSHDDVANAVAGALTLATNAAPANFNRQLGEWKIAH